MMLDFHETGGLELCQIVTDAPRTHREIGREAIIGGDFVRRGVREETGIDELRARPDVLVRDYVCRDERRVR